MSMADTDRYIICVYFCQFGRQWFFPIEASSLRTSIQEQLQRLFTQNSGTLDVSSDASPETLEVGVPRKLESEFWYATSTDRLEFGFSIFIQIDFVLTFHCISLKLNVFGEILVRDKERL